MQSVLRLLEDRIGMKLKHFFRDLLFAIGRQAVENNVSLRTMREEFFINLEITKESFLFHLSFLPH